MSTQTRSTDAHASHAQREATIVLVGNPNVGKSTLFNRVTGAQQKVMNAPGTTVDVMQGRWRTLGARVLDLPGTYSLIPNSPDEAVVAETLAGKPDSLTDPARGGAIDLVVAVLDGSSLTRSLYLLAQLGQTGRPVAVIVTMADVAKDDGVELDPSALSRALGVPVMLMDPRKASDYTALEGFVREGLRMRPRVKGIVADPSAPGYSQAVSEHSGCAAGTLRDERDLLAQTTCACGKSFAIDEDCAQEGCGCNGHVDSEEDSSVFMSLLGGTDKASSCGCGHARVTDLGIPPIGRMDEATDSGLPAAASTANQDPATQGSPTRRASGASVPSSSDIDPTSEAEIDRATTLFAWVDRVESEVSEQRPNGIAPSRSDKIDRILLHPVLGLGTFFALMWLLFKIAGEWVGPLQDLFDGWFTSTDPGAFSLANGFLAVLNALSLDGTWVQSLLVNGLATGLGVVASFAPLMFVIFAAISILEDSGYMARAAFLGDRLMRRIGLDGRVILPLIMGFGCNLPSLAAARSLPSATQRLVTVLITPYTSCAARLTIYLMIGKIFFPNNAGTVVFAMYVLSIVMVVLGAWVLKFFITKKEAQAPLMLILPAYQMPRLVVLLQRALQNSWIFIKGAGKIIVIMTMFVWLLGAIPMGANAADKGFAHPELAMEESAYGQLAKTLEPVFEPAGYGDWHMTGALMTGFVAKETVVSSIVTAYNMDPEAAGDAEENGDNLGVLPNLLNTTFTETAGEGKQGLAAFAFLVFVLTYTPCLATVAEQARLIGGRRTAAAVGVQLVVAWVLSVAVFQVGSLFL